MSFFLLTLVLSSFHFSTSDHACIVVTTCIPLTDATTGAAEQEFHIGVIVGVPLGVVLTLLLASALAVVGVALRRHYRKIKARSYRLMETTDATCMTNLDGESD